MELGGRGKGVGVSDSVVMLGVSLVADEAWLGKVVVGRALVRIVARMMERKE